MRRFASLRRQADFARLRRQGRRVTTKSLVIYRSDSLSGDDSSLVGITVSKSIGKAVIRNKVRRRLAAILHEALRRIQRCGCSSLLRPVAAAGPVSRAAGRDCRSRSRRRRGRCLLRSSDRRVHSALPDLDFAAAAARLPVLPKLLPIRARCGSRSRRAARALARSGAFRPLPSMESGRR